jgi:hypothetical protein
LFEAKENTILPEPARLLLHEARPVARVGDWAQKTTFADWNRCAGECQSKFRRTYEIFTKRDRGIHVTERIFDVNIIQCECGGARSAPAPLLHPPIPFPFLLQLTLNHHRKQILDLAGERGAPKLKEAMAVTSSVASAPGKKIADAKLWAAFVLSGVGK